MDNPKDFNGYTLDQLRYKRAQALLKLEIDKTQLLLSLNQMKNRANDHGMRGLLFRNDIIKQLRVADYVMAGFKLVKWYYLLRRKHRC